jgi:hypothetical protein
VLGLALNAAVLRNTGSPAPPSQRRGPAATRSPARTPPGCPRSAISTSTCCAGIPPPRRHPAACARCATRRPRRRLDVDQPVRLRLVSADFAVTVSRGPQRTCWIRTFPGGVVALRSPG